jgi:hypothetical protein
MQHHQPSNMILCSQTEEYPSIEGTCGNNLMIKLTPMINSQQINLKEIDSENIHIIEKIGDGLFGNIHLAEMKLINNEKQNVIIKSLNDNIDEKQK